MASQAPLELIFDDQSSMTITEHEPLAKLDESLLSQGSILDPANTHEQRSNNALVSSYDDDSSLCVAGPISDDVAVVQIDKFEKPAIDLK